MEPLTLCYHFIYTYSATEMKAEGSWRRDKRVNRINVLFPKVYTNFPKENRQLHRTEKHTHETITTTLQIKTLIPTKAESSKFLRCVVSEKPDINKHAPSDTPYLALTNYGHVHHITVTRKKFILGLNVAKITHYNQ